MYVHNLMYIIVVIQKMADSDPDADDEDRTTTTGMYAHTYVMCVMYLFCNTYVYYLNRSEMYKYPLSI